MASVSKHPSRNLWRVRYRDANGAQKTEYRKTQAAAKSRAAQVKVAQDQGAQIDPALGRVRLRDFGEDYFAGASDLAPKTRALQEGHFRNHIAPALGSERLCDLTPYKVERFIRSLRGRSDARTRTRTEAKPLGAATVSAVYRLLRRLLNVAVAQGRLARTPLGGVKPPRVPEKEMRFLDAAEVALLVAAIPEPYKVFVLMLAYGGFRVGELAALRDDRIEWERRRIRVEDQISTVPAPAKNGAPPARAGGRLERRETKTKRKRSIAMPRFVMDALDDHVRRYPPLPRRGDAVTDGLVFYGPQKGPIRADHFLDRVFAKAVRDAGLAPLRVHDLRHSAAAIAIQAGAHPKATQARLGHASITTTLDTYGHLLDGIDDALADRLDAMYERPDELAERRKKA